MEDSINVAVGPYEELGAAVGPAIPSCKLTENYSMLTTSLKQPTQDGFDSKGVCKTDRSMRASAQNREL